MSRQGNIPARSVRVPNEIWNDAKRRAAIEGRTVTDVVVSALKRYGRGRPVKKSPDITEES